MNTRKAVCDERHGKFAYFSKKHLVFLENEHTGEDDFPKMSLFKQKTSFKTLY